MGIETPKIEEHKEDEPKEDELQEQRMISDAELIRGGAKIKQGVLKPTEEQIEDIRFEMQKKMLETQKEKGEYSQKQEEDILRAAQNAGNLSDEWSLELSELKLINPEKFESLFNSKVSWDSVSKMLERELRDEDWKDYTRNAGFVKELSGDEFEQHIQISEKAFDKSLKESKVNLLPKFWQFGLFGRDFQLIHALNDVAALKILNEEKFNDKIKITGDTRDKLRREIENLLEMKDIPGKKVGKMRVIRGARILGISEEKKEK